MTWAVMRIERQIGPRNNRPSVRRSIGIYVGNGHGSDFAVFQPHRGAKVVDADHRTANAFGLSQGPECRSRFR